MEPNEIELRQALRTKTGFKLIYDVRRNRFSVQQAEMPQSELLQALAALNVDMVKLAQRVKHPERRTTCTGIDVKYVKDQIGVVFFGTQNYIGLEHTEKFSTPRYWFDGKVNPLDPAIRKKTEYLMEQLKIYAAFEGEPHTDQAALEFPEATPEPVKSLPKLPPQAKEVKGKVKVLGDPAFDVTMGAKKAAQKHAESLRGSIVELHELELTWHGSKNWFTVKFNNQFIGYVKKDGRKTIFQPSIEAKEKLDAATPHEFVTGDFAMIAAKKDKNPINDKLAQQVVAGNIASHSNIAVLMMHYAYCKTQKDWYIIGLNDRKEEVAILMNKDTTFLGAPKAKKREVVFDTEEQIVQRLRLFYGQYTNISNMYKGITIHSDLDKITQLSGDALNLARHYHNDVIMKAHNHYPAEKAEEFVTTSLETINLLDNVHTAAFEGKLFGSNDGLEENPDEDEILAMMEDQ